MPELEAIALLQLRALLLTNEAENRDTKEFVQDMLRRTISGEYPLTYLVTIDAVDHTQAGVGEFPQPTLRAAVNAAEETFFFEEGRCSRNFTWRAYMLVTFPAGNEISIPVDDEYLTEVFAFGDEIEVV